MSALLAPNPAYSVVGNALSEGLKVSETGEVKEAV